MLTGLHSEFPGEIEEGLLEQTCWKLFQVRLVRGVLRNPQALDQDEMDEFVGWVEVSVLRADALPLSLSQRLYNYTRGTIFHCKWERGLSYSEEGETQIIRLPGSSISFLLRSSW